MSHSYLTVAPNETDIRRIANVLRNTVEGKTNNRGTVTLTASQATTVVTDPRAGGESVLLFMPTTANAAAEQAAGGMWVSSRGTGTFTITHANNAQTDRDFAYLVVG